MLPNIGIEIAILSIIILGTILSLYKLAKKLSHDYVEYQYRYNEYQKSKEEIRGKEISLIPQSVNFLDPLMKIAYTSEKNL